MVRTSAKKDDLEFQEEEELFSFPSRERFCSVGRERHAAAFTFQAISVGTYDVLAAPMSDSLELKWVPLSYYGNSPSDT